MESLFLYFIFHVLLFGFDSHEVSLGLLCFAVMMEISLQLFWGWLPIHSQGSGARLSACLCIFFSALLYLQFVEVWDRSAYWFGLAKL